LAFLGQGLAFFREHRFANLDGSTRFRNISNVNSAQAITISVISELRLVTYTAMLLRVG